MLVLGIIGLNIEKNQKSINISGLLQYISPEKQHRVYTFRNPRDAQHALIGDLLIRAIACRYLNIKNGELQFQENKYGKPYLKGIENFCYNLSHSGKWVVCAADNEPIGVDIEEIVPIQMDIAQRYFSKEEMNYVMEKPESKRVEAFYNIWTFKESYIKALGFGLSKELNSFSINIINDERAVIKESHIESPALLRQYPIDDQYRLSLCEFKNCFPEEVQIVDMKWILDGINIWGDKTFELR